MFNIKSISSSLEEINELLPTTSNETERLIVDQRIKGIIDQLKHTLETQKADLILELAKNRNDSRIFSNISSKLKNMKLDESSLSPIRTKIGQIIVGSACIVAACSQNKVSVDDYIAFLDGFLGVKEAEEAGCSLFFKAIAENKPTFIPVLKRLGANPNATGGVRDTSGLTPL